MSEVKRYNMDTDKFGAVRPYESEHGRWVKHSQYAALEAERDALRAELAALKAPAEADGVKRWTLEVDCLYPSEEGGWCEYDDHLAALSAVTDERDRLREALACDRAYRNGLQAGYSFGACGDEEGYQRSMAAYGQEILAASTGQEVEK